MGDQSAVARDSMLGFGTLLQVNLPGTGWTTLAGVMDLDGPELSTEEVKVTHQESPDATHEYLPGLKDGGSISFDVVYIPGSPAHGNAPGGLAYEWRTRQVRDWRIVWPDSSSTTWSIRGFLTGFKPAAPLEDRLSASISIRVAAAPTLA